MAVYFYQFVKAIFLANYRRSTLFFSWNPGTTVPHRWTLTKTWSGQLQIKHLSLFTSVFLTKLLVEKTGAYRTQFFEKKKLFCTLNI